MLLADGNLKMVQVVAAELVDHWPSLINLYMGYAVNPKDRPTKEELTETLGRMVDLCQLVGWSDLRDQTRRFLRRALDGEWDGMGVLASDLREAFEQKTITLHAVLIEERDSQLFTSTIPEFCGGALHPDLSISEEEFTLAGRALALGLSTAAVSHAMRSVEASLHILASQLGIVFPAPIQLQDWKVLTDKIKSVIDGLEKQSRSQQKSERLKMLSELLLPVDAFRTVWRNHVAHAREKYEYDEARKAITHVGSYLGTLSRTI